MARFNNDQVKAFVKENNLKTMDEGVAAETLQSMLEAKLDTKLVILFSFVLIII
ncbi:hypothetical protein D3C80_2104390 [compost metagenome]